MSLVDTLRCGAHTVPVDESMRERRAGQERERVQRLRRAVESVAETRKVVAERLARSEARRAS